MCNVMLEKYFKKKTGKKEGGGVDKSYSIEIWSSKKTVSKIWEWERSVEPLSVK